MARRVRDETDVIDDSDETTTTLEGGALGVPEALAKQTIGGVQVAPTDKTFEPVVVERFVVMANRQINTPTGVASLRQGQVVDEQNYDIATLERLGVPLQRVKQ